MADGTPAAPTEVSGVDVVAKKKPPMTGDQALAARIQYGDQIGRQQDAAVAKADAEWDQTRANAEAREKPIRMEQDEAFRGMQTALEDLRHPPKMQQAQQTTPQQMWSSSAMVFAALGSLLTRRPLMTAMNAAASALKAFQSGNQQAVNAAFAQWKQDSEQFYKIAEYEQKVYQDLLSDARERLAESGRQTDREMRDIETRLRATAAALQDKAIVNADSLKVMVERLDARDRNLTTMQSAGVKLEQGLLQQQALREHIRTHPNETREQRLQFINHMLTESKHEWTDQQVETEVNKANAEYDRNAVAKAYVAAQQHYSTIMSLDPNAPVTNKSVIAQVSALDQWAQLMNGNKALRSFQLKMVHEDEGVWNAATRKLHQFTGSGPLTPDMIEAIQDVARMEMKVSTFNYGQLATAVQHDKYMLRLDPTLFQPHDFNPGATTGAVAYPSPLTDAAAGDRDMLIAHRMDKQTWLQFDQVYGPGAAALVLQEHREQTENAEAPEEGSETGSPEPPAQPDA